MAVGLCVQPHLLLAREGYPLDVRIQGPDEKGLPGVSIRSGRTTTVTDADGVGRFETMPAGGTALEILHPGFDRLRTNTVVQAGHRELTLRLTPERLLSVEVSVVDAETSGAIAGATVSLVPIRVPSSLSGPLRACTDFGGKVTLGNLPAGTYRASVTAPGLKPWTEQRTFDPESLAWDVALVPLVDATAAWSVRVLDARSGAAVAGATVLVEESPGSGALANAVSAADGLAAITNIPIGRINRAKDGVLPRGRRAAVALVEAPGYAPARRPAVFGGEAQAIRLTPLAPVNEIEPNNTLAEAQVILPDSVVVCSIEAPDDVDAFQFDLACDSLVRIELAAAPVERVLRGYDAEGKALREGPAYAGQALSIDLGGRRAGRHFFTVEEWGRNGASPEKFEARVVTTAAPDPGELNDSLAEARLVQAGEWIHGTVLPAADADFFRFRVDRPGMARLFMAPGHPLERVVRMLDETGVELGEVPAYGGNPLDLVCRIGAPGQYVFSIEEWGRNGESATPYELRLDFVPDDGTDDPAVSARPLRAVRELPLPGRVHDTIFPVGDVDTYNLRVPHAGRVVVEASGPTELVGELLTQNGTSVSVAPAYPHQVLRLSYDADQAANLVMVIREWGDNNASTSPYMIRAWLESAESLEAVQRNESPGAAFPADVGELISGSIFPMNDQDFYRIEIPYPGLFRVQGTSPLETVLNLARPDGSPAFSAPSYPGACAAEALLLPGMHVLQVSEWGNNACSTQPYRLGVSLARAEPGETVPLNADPMRPLVLGQARAFTIDQPGDVDRFVFETPGKLDATLRVFSPLEGIVRVYDDRTGQVIHDRPWYPGIIELPIQAENPTRFRIELREWGDNAWSLDSGFLLLAPAGKALAADRVRVAAVPGDGLEFAFSRAEIPGLPRPTKVTVDVDGNGSVDCEVPEAGTRNVRLPAAGAYRAKVAMTGDGQAPTTQEIWVEGRQRTVREGVLLTVDEPTPGQQLERAIPLVARAFSYTTKPVTKVSFVLDGKTRHDVFSPPYEWPVDWQQVTGKEHQLQVVAVDGDGNRTEVKRAFTLSPFMGLQPADAATLSGQQVMVSWLGTDFGKARVRWRVAGKADGEWTTVDGEDGRFRTLALKGLEPGRKYEFQALSGADKSPVRTFDLVKGLAFGRSRYGATIRRDYDQRLGISVRNNGDKALNVRLECGRPTDPLMLAGFVGEGSEDTPIPLAPGEEREFQLNFSAQDVVTPEHALPIRIVSDTGLSDEAEVAVRVVIPRVELAWADLGPAPRGQGRIFRLSNPGDGITDLSVTCAGGDTALISPTVRHGLLPAGGWLDFQVSPRYYRGYTGVETRIVASALNKAFDIPFVHRLGPGEAAYQVWLIPGFDPSDPAGRAQQEELKRRAVRGEALDAAKVNWGKRTAPEDRDGDGRPDQWTLVEGDVRWFGEDTDGDGQIDFAHADVGDDGIFEYSAMLEGDRWHATNLVEAWLEMGFSLPWGAGAYLPHDVDVVLNDQVIGRLRDAIPDGNYAFRIPPHALRFDASGMPGANTVGIRSKHLRGGHYIVNSDFRFKLRLTSTPVWMVSTSEHEAERSAAAAEGVSVASPDFSVSSADLRIRGPAAPKSGDPLAVEITMRNLGGISPPEVPVALLRISTGRPPEEVARVVVKGTSTDGGTVVTLPWVACGGSHTLQVVVDPEGLLQDSDTANNTASGFVKVSGEGEPPRLVLRRPADGATIPGPVVDLTFDAAQEDAHVTAAVSIDGGLWTDLPVDQGVVSAALLLQPGTHQLQLRATGLGGLSATQTAKVSVEAPLPETSIIFPVEGTNIQARATHVLFDCPQDALLAAARVAGGPWMKASRIGRIARTHVPLSFGSQTLEVMVVSRDGAAATKAITVVSTRQPVPGQLPDAKIAAPENGLIRLPSRPGLELDAFKTLNGVLQKGSQP